MCMSCRRTVTVKCGICGVPTRTSTAACTQHSARFGVNPARYQRSQGAAAHSARAGTLSKKALGSRSCCPCWCARLPLGTYYHTAVLYAFVSFAGFLENACVLQMLEGSHYGCGLQCSPSHRARPSLKFSARVRWCVVVVDLDHMQCTCTKRTS